MQTCVVLTLSRYNVLFKRLGTVIQMDREVLGQARVATNIIKLKNITYKLTVFSTAVSCPMLCFDMLPSRPPAVRGTYGLLVVAAILV